MCVILWPQESAGRNWRFGNMRAHSHKPHCKECSRGSMGRTELTASWQKWKWEEHEWCWMRLVPFRVLPALCLQLGSWESRHQHLWSCFPSLLSPQALHEPTRSEQVFVPGLYSVCPRLWTVMRPNYYQSCGRWHYLDNFLFLTIKDSDLFSFSLK